MLIRYLKLKNFGIYSGEQHVQFGQEFNTKQNITLIGGMNGRGKTTILEAILLVLYGNRAITAKESGMSYSAYLKKCINKSNPGGTTTIELSFSIPLSGEITDIKIIRTWSGKHKRMSDSLEVWRNSHYDKYLTEHWDTYVEELLPSGISSLFFFDGEKIIGLAEEEETSATMQEAIKALLGIDIIDKLIIDMKRIIKQNENTIDFNNQHQEEINQLEKETEDIEAKISILKQEKAKLSSLLEYYRKEITKKEETFIKQGGSLLTSRQQLLQEKYNLEGALKAITEKLIDQAAGPLPLLLVTPLLKQTIKTVKIDEEIKVAKNIRSYLEQIQKRFKDKINSIDIAEDHKKLIESFLEEERQKLSQLQKNSLSLNLSPSGAELIKELLLKIESKFYNELCNEINRVNDIERQLEQIERHLLFEIEETETNQMLDSIKKGAAKIKELELEIKKVTEDISSLENQLIIKQLQLQKLLQKALNNRNTLDDFQRIIAYAAITQEIMHEFKSRLILKKIAGLANKINECFNYIIQKKSLVSKIEIDPETLKLTLFDSNNEIILKSQLSAGEKQMLAISILWGLAQSSGRALPIIIDTPLGRLDSSHRLNFITRYLPNASHQVIVLSTDEEIKDTYLELLQEHIAKKYLLKYDDEERATTVVEGYFQGDAS